MFCCLSSNDDKNKPKSDMSKNGATKSNVRSVSLPAQSTSTNTGHKKKAPRRLSADVVGSTKWLSLKTLHWTDEEGHERKWDVASRTTKQESVPDAVVIIPIMKSVMKNTIETLLVEQYRPPISKYALEFPAGLIDKGETAQQTAVRELWEETGYVGTVDTTFGAEELCMTPGLSDETVQIVVVNVDLDDPRNNNPKQHQDEGESITVSKIPLTLGLKKVLETSPSMPISLLYSFAIGLEMGAKYFK